MPKKGHGYGGGGYGGGYGGYGDMPLDSGDYGLTDPGMAGIEGMEGYGSGVPEDGMIYSEDGMPMGMGMEGPAAPWTGEVHLHVPSFYDDPYVRISETVFQDNKESDPSSAAISVLRRPDRVIIDLSKQTTFFNQAKRVEED